MMMGAAAWLPCDGRVGEHKCTGGARYQGPLNGSHIPDWLEQLQAEGWRIGHRIVFCPRCAKEHCLNMGFMVKQRFRELTGDELL